MKDNGKKIRKMDSVYSFTLIMKSMKETGLMDRNTEKVHTTTHLGTNTLDNG
jgi:hypothetical protein